MNALVPIPVPTDVAVLAETYDASARRRTRIALWAAGALALIVIGGGALVPIGGRPKAGSSASRTPPAG